MAFDKIHTFRLIRQPIEFIHLPDRTVRQGNGWFQGIPGREIFEFFRWEVAGIILRSSETFLPEMVIFPELSGDRNHRPGLGI